MKNEKSGFSLIEVLIALIIISLVTSAMAPVISKKLIATGAFITVKGGGSAFCDAGQYLEDSGSCADCPKGFFCVNNEKIQCLEGQISDVAQSACTTCENGFYANETQDKCIKCEAGNYCTQGKKTTCPDGSTSTEGQYFCTSCPEGYYCQNGEQKSCESKFTNCTTCTQSACLSCKSGFDIQNKTCVLKGFSQAFCDSLGSNLLYLTATQNGGTAACVTKANVGDTYMNGPEISPSAGVKVVSTDTCGLNCDSSGKCCWLGNNVGYTAHSCNASGNGNSTYSGCKRTVCTWAAAKAACENWAPTTATKGKWRLPTKNELSAWGEDFFAIQVNQGKSGLELCNSESGYGSVQCSHYDFHYGYSNDNCRPYGVWSSDWYDSSNMAVLMPAQDSFYLYGYSRSLGLSARCIMDEKDYKKSIIRSQSDCDKYGKNLLFLTEEQNGGKRACVTKANVGDSYADGPNLFKIRSEAGITVVYAGKTCGSREDYSGRCCWLGNNDGTTASDCGASGNGDSAYSGCKRTVCTWAAAKAACRFWAPTSETKGKWRLPTKNELSAWGSNLSTIQKNQGKSGLELCDRSSGYGSVHCSYHDSACPGAYGNGCNPYYVWSSDEYGSSSVYYYSLGLGTFSTSYFDKTNAFSARCVLDEDALKSL